MKKNFVSILPLPDRYNRDSLIRLTDYYNNPSKIKEDILSLWETRMVPSDIAGKKVLIKPNWVKHSSQDNDEICLRTNDNFVLSVLTIVLEQKPAEVVIGDAPLQGCRWHQMISDSFQEDIAKLSKKHNVLVRIEDFRRRHYIISENAPVSEINPIGNYIIFDLGVNSILEEITTTGKSRFRVNNYDPDRMALAHGRGIHKYCIVKEFFDTDVVISLPKIKTHQKTGITGALKNIVGINGDKDFLPHHRIGGVGLGGDCYPGRSQLRLWSELLTDKANRKQGTKYFWLWQKPASLLWALSFPGREHNIDAGWYGNDTTWRMVHDLNKIAVFGRSDGSLSDMPQRKILSICDGIIGGQGEGPLNPQPLPLGIISFTDNSMVNDQAMAILMGFPPERMPLLQSSYLQPYCGECEITFSHKEIALDDLKQYSVKTLPPKGWAKYFSNYYENCNSTKGKLIQ